MQYFSCHLPGLLQQLGRPRAPLRPLNKTPLSKLQALLLPLLPAYLFSPQDEGSHSRRRNFDFATTFFGFLWQVLNPGASCLLALRQIQAANQYRFPLSADTSPYCQARKKLPLERLLQIFYFTVRLLEQRLPEGQLWRGFRLKVVDGTCLSSPDTSCIQALFPQESQQKPGCGFPLIRAVFTASLGSGAIIDYNCYSQRSHDMELFHKLRPNLRPGDLLLVDRGLSSYAQTCLLQKQGVDVIQRLHQGKVRHGGRSRLQEIQKLGPGDYLALWKNTGTKPPYMNKAELESIPPSTIVRVIAVQIEGRGMRTRNLVLVTTLLDAKTYPAHEIAALYQQRWMIEGYLRDLKTTMQMDVLRCKSPEMLEKEIVMHLIAYNLVRLLMQESSLTWHVPLDRISYKGALTSLHECLVKMNSRREAKKMYAWLIAAIARGYVPKRPGRKEPRAVKRRPKNHQWLTAPRHHFKEDPHRGKYNKYNKNKRS